MRFLLPALVGVAALASAGGVGSAPSGTVRMQRTGEVVAVGEVTRDGGWLSGSKTCIEGER